MLNQNQGIWQTILPLEKIRQIISNRIGIFMPHLHTTMPEQRLNLYHWPIHALLELVRTHFDDYTYHQKRHIIELMDSSGHPFGYIRMPLRYSISSDLILQDDETSVLYLSVESGNAALCLMKGMETTFHTTFSAYMTRKKQGFSQIKYLNKKGKSRAGSRVRLAETVTFFETINKAVNELWTRHSDLRIALNCNKTLLPYLLKSKVPFPLANKDPALYKIPLHIHQSNFTNLEAAIKKLSAPVLHYKESYVDHTELFKE